MDVAKSFGGWIFVGDWQLLHIEVQSVLPCILVEIGGSLLFEEVEALGHELGRIRTPNQFGIWCQKTYKSNGSFDAKGAGASPSGHLSLIGTKSRNSICLAFAH